MHKDSTQFTLLVALVLCLVCSIVVSGAAVSLKPLQEKNKGLDIKRNILQVADLWRPGIDIENAFSSIEAHVIDLRNGREVENIDAESYDQRAAARDPAQSSALNADDDAASIRRRAHYAKVYHLIEEGRLSKIILPIHGYGLWSTLYGYIALQPDANTIAGLKFYEHRETPGLGGEVDNPKWRQQWIGKQIYNEAGQPVFAVAKGRVADNDPAGVHKVDGLSGATLTGNGVTHMMNFWFGELGFKPYLQNLAQR